MLDSVLGALDLLFTARGALFLALGTVVGLIFGAIPGLGGTTAIALLIPLTFGMQPYEAITLMGGVMGSVAFGGSVSAILLNTPGIAPNAATCFDGYPLAQQGKAGLAIGAAATASSVGGLIGVVILVAVIPIAKQIVLLFGPPEFFMLAVMGLGAIALSTGGKFLRGLVAGALGLALAFVGYDAVSGGMRFTLGSDYLWDGIPLVPALTGLFAISEMINLTAKGGTVAATNAANVRISRVGDGVRAVFRNYPVLLRGSTIGAFIGAVPGVGGTVASFLSYASTVQADKDPESFGKGNVKGVIAPESANNAKDGGALIPTLAFGIPGSAEMAIFLGVLIQHGLQPGPLLLIEHEGVIFSLILALAVACVLASMVGLAIARQLTMITLVDVHILVPAVVSIALVGVYALHTSIGDVLLALAFGGIGYLMIRFDYPRITLVIALVLGELAERSFHQSMMMSDGAYSVFVSRGISLGLLIVTVLILLAPAARLGYARARARADSAPRPTRAAGRAWNLWRLGMPVALLALSAVFLAWAYRYDPRPRMVPVLTGWVLVLLCALDAMAATGTRWGDWVGAAFSGEAARTDEAGAARQSLRRVLIASAWVAAFVGAVLAVGFLVAIPVYVALFVIVQGKMSLRRGAAAAVATSAFTAIVFEWLMQYPVYRGFLFEP